MLRIHYELAAGFIFNIAPGATLQTRALRSETSG
jgi:hypothetical protein